MSFYKMVYLPTDQLVFTYRKYVANQFMFILNFLSRILFRLKSCSISEYVIHVFDTYLNEYSLPLNICLF